MHQPDGQKPAPGWAGFPLARGMRPVGGSGAAAAQTPDGQRIALDTLVRARRR